MTTFQDPQPQSRRAVRQGERGDAVETPTESFPAQPPAAPTAPQFFSDAEGQRDMWDTNARRAAQLPSTPAARPESAVSGRRAASASQPPAAAEPLNYATASRQPAAPSYDPLAFRSRLDARQAQQPAPAEPQPEQTFRVRDFSPEGRRAAQATERAASAPAWMPAPPSDLEYQTEVREGFGVQQAPAVPAPISHIPAQYAPQREVPELVEPPLTFSAPPPAFAAPPAPAAFVAPMPVAAVPEAVAPETVAVVPEVVEPDPVVEPEPVVAPDPVAVAPDPVAVAPQPVDAPEPAVAPEAAASQLEPETPAAVVPASVDAVPAPAEQTLSRRELRALMSERQAGAQQPESLDQATYNLPVAWRTPEPDPFPVATPAAAVPAEVQAAEAQDASAAEAAVQEQPAQEPQPDDAAHIPETVFPAAAPQSSTNTGMTDALAEFDALTRPAAATTGDDAAWRPPTGHWSTQSDVEDDAVDSTINRRVGSGSSTTHALVLPEIPLGSDIRGPLTSTGEVMLTGSIDLPHTLSSTGTSEQMEHAGIDSLFDLSDHEVISTDSQPVRAIKAVSTHQTGHGVTHTQKPKGTRALTVLLISASSMAVVVAGLLVAAFAFNIL